MTAEKEQIRPIQVKICGLTKVTQAKKIAALGVDAVGLVFYPKSKRHIDMETAYRIQKSLPDRVWCVGVFVDEPFSTIMEKVRYCHLDAVQLHGNETRHLVEKLQKEHLMVIKALYMDGKPHIKNAEKYRASACLVECSAGKLPGGNAQSWRWGRVRSYSLDTPLILAGGLTPENIETAVLSGRPDAVDISSGVEADFGDKDLLKVKMLLENLTIAREKINPDLTRKIRTVFYERKN